MKKLTNGPTGYITHKGVRIPVYGPQKSAKTPLVTINGLIRAGLVVAPLAGSVIAAWITLG